VAEAVGRWFHFVRKMILECRLGIPTDTMELATAQWVQGVLGKVGIAEALTGDDRAEGQSASAHLTACWSWIILSIMIMQHWGQKP
jgi:hypothetical protein